MLILKSFLIFTLSFFLIFLCNKKKFLLNQSGDNHQKFTSEISTPLLGGIILFLSIFVFNFKRLDLFFFSTLAILLVGLLSDLKKLNSPILRLGFQLFIILLTVNFLSLFILGTKINFLDYLLTNNFFAIIFTSFCILIILNGTNFIDGINSLTIGYYIIISLTLFFLEQQGFTLITYFSLELMLICLAVLYFLNLFNKLYLGDSGAYLLGFLFSIELINFYLQNNSISPFFIILLLWYPAFENLFSILRKTNFKKSPINTDTSHLHQLIFSYFIKKKYAKLKASTVTTILINSYNGIIVMVSLIDPHHTKFQIILLTINLTTYTFLYFKLQKRL